MPITNVADLVPDWGGFETLVAELHATGEVKIERDVVLQGRSGVTRQIDVLLRHRQNFYEHLVIIECKYLRRAVTRAVVDALATAVQDLGAARGVIFSSSGFQKGAVRQARHENVDLFRVRDVSLPDHKGRYTNCLYRLLQYCPLSVRSVSKSEGQETELKWTLSWREIESGEQPRSEVGGANGLEEGNFDALLSSALQLACNRYESLIDHQHRGRFSYTASVELTPLAPVTVTDQTIPLEVHRFHVELGISGYQDKFVVDRMQKLAFILAVEDCVRGCVRVISKNKRDLKFLEISELAESPNESLLQQSPELMIYISLGQTSPEQFANLIPSLVHYSLAS